MNRRRYEPSRVCFLPKKEKGDMTQEDLYLLRLGSMGSTLRVLFLYLLFFQLMNQPTENNHAMLTMLIYWCQRYGVYLYYFFSKIF